MPVRQKVDNVLVWASDIDPKAIQQAARTARMPFVKGDLALMPDGHVGMGATVGSVFATSGAIIPSAIGVDIGCGMIAVLTDLTLEDLPDDLDALMTKVEMRIPAGVGKGFQNRHVNRNQALRRLDSIGKPRTELTSRQCATVENQYGTLGSGNHFAEVCYDESNRIWLVLHSGSRGIGNQLAQKHIKTAKALMKQNFIKLEDPDLAYLVQGTNDFDAYIADMLWAQDYAYGNRDQMMRQFVESLFEVVGFGHVVDTINCHHNFTQRENHRGQNLWITRKGAIKADVTDWGVIPGSMGTDTFIIKGLGNPASFNSCSHGAGRRMSRTAAKSTLTAETLRAYMSGQTWNAKAATQLVDEHPDAYKDINQVMADQADLCKVMYRLSSVFNYKGVK